MSVFGLTQGWQRQPWAKTGERRRRYIPWAGTGERRRRYIRLGWNGRTPKAYIRLGWNGRTPKALHTLGLELANAEGVTYPGLELANAEGVTYPGLELANAEGVTYPGLKLANAQGVTYAWAGTGERPRRYIRLGWNGRTPKALHTLGLELANAFGVRNSGLTRLHTNFPLHQLSVTPTFRYTNFPLHQLKALGVLRNFDGPAEAFFYVGGHCVCRFGFAVGEKGPTRRRGLHPLQPVQHFFTVRMRGEAADLCHATTYRNPLL